MDTAGEAEGGANWESSIDTYSLPYVKYIANEKFYKQGAQLGTQWQPRGVGLGGGGREFKRKGTYVYLWLIHTVVGQKPMQHCKEWFSN